MTRAADHRVNVDELEQDTVFANSRRRRTRLEFRCGRSWYETAVSAAVILPHQEIDYDR